MLRCMSFEPLEGAPSGRQVESSPRLNESLIKSKGDGYVDSEGNLWPLETEGTDEPEIHTVLWPWSDGDFKRISNETARPSMPDELCGLGKVSTMSGPFPDETLRPLAPAHQPGWNHRSTNSDPCDSPSERLAHALSRDARLDARDVLKLFAAPANFTHRTVLDLGSDLGESGFECLRRNARHVIGFQPSQDDTQHCRMTADRLGVAARCEFHEADLRQILDSPGTRASFASSCEQADVVFCSAANLNGESLCDLLCQLTTEVCYLELDTHSTAASVMEHARAAGFMSALPVGRLRTSSGDNRHCLVLDKKVLLSERSEQRRYRGFRFGERYLKGVVPRTVWNRFSRRYVTPNSRYDHRTYRLGDRYVRDFASMELWKKVRSLYARIAHIPFVQECDFTIPGRLTSPIYAQNLAEAKLTPDERDDVRRQVVLLIRQLNQAGVAHRDLHCGNFFLDEGQIRLVDLEFLEVDTQPLRDCYDLTGEGLASPLKSGHMNAFKDFSLSLKNVIGLTPRDFGLSEVTGHDGHMSRAAA